MVDNSTRLSFLHIVTRLPIAWQLVRLALVLALKVELDTTNTLMIKQP